MEEVNNIYYEEPTLMKKDFGLVGCNELWMRICNIKGYEDIEPMYWLSNYGKVFSEYTGLLTQTFSFDYAYVMLRTIYGGMKRVRVHRLVMLGFNYFEGCESYEVNHKDGNKSKNVFTNLEWNTRKENMDHAVEHGLAASCENSYKATITNEQAIKICELLSTGEYLCTEIADIVGCQKCIVNGIAGRNTWIMISRNYVFRKRVCRAFPNSVLAKILEFVYNTPIANFNSKMDYYSALIQYSGLVGVDPHKNRILDLIYSDPDSYKYKLDNCTY